MTILPTVVPFRGTRGLDAWGAGGYNAPRRHRGQASTHTGVDLVSIAGDQCVAPISGIFFATGQVYAWGTSLRSLHLRGIDEAHGATVTLFYVHPDIPLSTRVKQGDPIGTAQDVSGEWWERIQHIEEEWARSLKRRNERMTNHVHCELRLNGVKVDPTPYFVHMGDD